MRVDDELDGTHTFAGLVNLLRSRLAILVICLLVYTTNLARGLLFGFCYIFM